MEKKIYLGTGRRKSSVAQVKMTSGSGKITVNGRDVREFFRLQVAVKLLLMVVMLENSSHMKLMLWI